ncbi:hypothetical protein GCM10029964_089000 [Kibdelosporangium lantanae]
MVDELTGRMLGLVVATATGRDSTDVYAIPLVSLTGAWPEVFSSVPSSPYKGLEAFEREDRAVFFGRLAITEELVRRVDTSGLVPVVGASGVGKSSLVHAGLVPRLLEQSTSRWTIVSVLPRPALSLALAAGFARAAGGTGLSATTELDKWEQWILHDTVDHAARRLCAITGADRLLLVIDQFEESVDEDAAKFDVILTQLAAMAGRRRHPLVVVLALREDAFGAFFLRHSDFGERLRENAIPLRGMNPPELYEAIDKPALLRGVTVRKPLANRLARDVSGRPGALPLLEFSLDQMWQTLRPGQQELSFDAYEAIGRLDGALNSYANKVVDALDESEQAVARRLFLTHLTSPDDLDTRQVARREDIAPADWPVVLRLAHARLLTVGQDGEGKDTVEVVHEALLRAWERLRIWLDAEEPFRRWRRLLNDIKEQTAQEGRPAVLTGTVLAASERWLADRGADLTLPERQLIEESLRRQDEEQHRYQRLYLRSRARALAMAAEHANDDEVALLLAVEALAGSPDFGTDQLVRTCLRRLGISEVQPVPTLDGVRAGHRMTLRDWATATREQTWSLGEENSQLMVDDRGRATMVHVGHSVPASVGFPVVVAAHVPEARTACLIGEQGQIRVVQTGAEAQVIGGRDLAVPVMCAAMSRAADVLAVATDDYEVRVLEATGDLDPLHTMEAGGFIDDIDINLDAGLVAALTLDGQVLVWRLGAREIRHLSLAGARRPIAITDRGDYLLVGSGSDRGRIPIAHQALAALARSATDRVLTDAEWRRHVGEEPTLG